MPLFDAASLQQAVNATPNAYAQAAVPAAKTSGVGVSPYLALAAGEAADLGTTLDAIHSGRGQEANPLMAGGTASLIATKAGTAVLVAYLMHQLAKEGHPVAAKWLGYTMGAGSGALAAHNAMVGR